MKFALSLVAACAGLLTVSAQLAPCPQGCVDRVQAEFSCADPEFASGITDCASEACSGSDASDAIDYVNRFCGRAPGAGVSTTATTVVSTSVDTTVTTSTDRTATTSTDRTATTSTDRTATTSTDTTASTSTDTATKRKTVTNTTRKTQKIRSTPATTSPLIATVSASDTTFRTTTGRTTIFRAAKPTAGGRKTTTSSDAAGVGATAAPLAGALGVAALLFV